MNEDRLEITVHFKDGDFPRELVINRAGREVDHVDMDGRRLEDVVRCRDCEHYEYREHLGRSYCCGEYATEPDGFCAWPERRVEE